MHTQELIEQRNELTERGAYRRKVIEVNASVFKKLKDICENYEKLKEKYEKDKKKRIVGSLGEFIEWSRESSLPRS